MTVLLAHAQVLRDWEPVSRVTPFYIDLDKYRNNCILAPGASADGSISVRLTLEQTMRSYPTWYLSRLNLYVEELRFGIPRAVTFFNAGNETLVRGEADWSSATHYPLLTVRKNSPFRGVFSVLIG